MTYKSRQDLLLVSSFRVPEPSGRAGKEHHSAPTCTTQSGRITLAFLRHRNLVKFRGIVLILNFQLGRGPNPRMMHLPLSSNMHKKKDVCHINDTSDFQVVPQPHRLRRLTSMPDLAF